MNTTQPLVELLPRDLEHDGMSLTQLYRSHSQGGNVVYLQNSRPGEVNPGMIHVFAIEIVDQREQLGAKLLTTRNADYGIAVAAANA
jgi:hypothetical protein